MSDKTTITMAELYTQEAQPTMFLSGVFRSPPGNFHSSEEIEIDIIRSREDVSIVINDLTVGYRMNSGDIYTNKKFIPPVHKEAMPLNAFDLLKRMPGQNPFQSPDFRANVMLIMFRGMRLIEAKIRRAVELQAAQILQTGKVSLTDSDGKVLFSIDYKPKVTHFPIVSPDWNDAGATIVEDLMNLSEVLRADGLSAPDQIIMSTRGFEAFVKSEEIRKRLETRRISIGTISPMEMRGNGGTFRGVVDIGAYQFDIWTYGGMYVDPQTGDTVPFIDKDKVIMRSSIGRLDATFGNIPNFNSLIPSRSASLFPELPRRMSNGAGGADLFTNIWMSDDGEHLFASVGSRPLLIPTAIDTYGCLSGVVV